MADLGKAYVQIVPSAQGISGSISNALKGESNAAGTSAGANIAGKIKGALVKAGIGAALGLAVKKSLEAGGALQQSFGGLETIYGNAAGAAKQYAKEAYKAGISTNDYAEQAVSFGAALKQAYGGDTTKAVKAANTAILDMTDNAAKMGTPMEAIQNAYQGFAKQNYTMLDNLKLGYGGTKSEMERLLADAQKLSGQKYDISNLGDVYDAIHVIQKDLGLTGVAAQEASETFTGSFGAMKAAATNFMAALSLGQDVGPAMQSLVQTTVTFVGKNLIPMVVNIFKNLPTAIMAGIQTAAPMVKSAGQRLVTFFTSGGASKMFESGKALLLKIANGILTGYPAALNAIANLIPRIVTFLQQNLPKIAEKGGQMIGELAKSFITHLPQIMVAIGRLSVAIVRGILKIIPVLAKAAVSLVGGLVKGLGGGAAEKVKAAAGRIRDAILAPIRAVVARIKFVVASIKEALSFSGFSSKVKSAFNRVKNAITSPIDSAKDKIKGAIDKIRNFFPLSIGKIFSNLRIPTISVSGGKAPFGIAGKGSLPKFSVAWNDKAMNQPYMFSGATLFGAGETGDEVLYGRSNLMRDISEAVNGRGNVTNYFNITVDGAEKPEDFADRLVKRIRMEMRTV